MSAIPTVIVTASPLALSRLGRALEGLEELRLCGRASDLSGAYVRVEEVEPKLVILGPELMRHPDFPGLLAMFRVMGIAWMRIASGPPPPGAGGQAPALDPALPPAAMLAAIRAALARPAAPPAPVPPKVPAVTGRSRADRFILIGASTGGIDALSRVLSVFPADCPPTAIVQHTGAAFSGSLIRLLDRACAARVLAAQPGAPFLPGMVVVGAGCGGHLRLLPGLPPRVEVASGNPVSGHLPSVDELFRSALPFAPRVTAALLTGMGRDGAQGMLELRRAGAATLAQDEASSVVYGMPRAAWETGAAAERLPLDRIGPALLARCAEPRAEGGR
ncbi:chemotaxis protein CheB [Rhodobacter sp. SGA-6-6]|uniref:CheB methylesterase domain-containing protein n=1 Tax=Rhodobacter sp. SGA-6-6 TaxID=2710882 RepID=UPI0013EB9020|nr:CheB methylesterase domain-containing protein [Rhodobacter sp. SGA-6-6]NGM47159.1 chemotaxis protein CheB [Rhodobacter sp. SGA-6-6]